MTRECEGGSLVITTRGSALSTMRECIYENRENEKCILLRRVQQFDVTNPEGLRITPSVTTKTMERIAILQRK